VSCPFAPLWNLDAHCTRRGRSLGSLQPFDRVFIFFYGHYGIRLFLPLQFTMSYAYPIKAVYSFLPIQFCLAPFVLALIVWVLWKLKISKNTDRRNFVIRAQRHLEPIFLADRQLHDELVPLPFVSRLVNHHSRSQAFSFFSGDRVGGGLAPAVLSHHRTYGSVYTVHPAPLGFRPSSSVFVAGIPPCCSAVSSPSKFKTLVTGVMFGPSVRSGTYCDPC
jgi:hypothetical protein